MSGTDHLPHLGNYGTLREGRLGVMLHYDGSASDAGAEEWLLRDPQCKLSYNWLVNDAGHLLMVAPADKRAWHAGICRPSSKQLVYQDANSAFYGIAIAARPPDTVTVQQLEVVVAQIKVLFIQHAWQFHETWRIVGHDTECWPRGRKIDPTGPDERRPVLDVLRVRSMVRGVL